MPEFQFPESQPADKNKFHNLNGDGGRLQLMIASAFLLFLTASSFWFGKEGQGINWTGLFLLSMAVFFIFRLLNVTTVEYSSNELRLQRRGKQFIVPFINVASVGESARFLGGQAIGTANSRYVTVRLNREFPFGRSFSFYTKREYTEFDGLSGPAKLIEKFAAMRKAETK